MSNFCYWKRSKLQRLSVPILIAFLLVLLISSVAHAGSTTELENKIAREERTMTTLQKQVKQHREAISSVKRKEKGVLQELSNYDQKIKLAEQKIRVLELKQEKVKKSIMVYQKQIKQADSDLSSMTEAFQDRLVSIYKYGGTAGLELLLSAPSAHEAMTTSFLLSKIARQDRDIIQSVKKRKNDLQEACMLLEEKRSLLDSQAAELRSAKKNYSRESSNRNDLLSRLKREKSLHLKAAKELERSQREIKNKISVLAKKKKELENRRKSNTSINNSMPVTYMKAGAKLAWPVKGRITSGFGTRVHPIFKTRSQHTGIDISAGKGTPVRAAQDGNILFSGWLRGYGQIIIMDHGRNLTTVYAHLSSTGVQEGQGVKLGQVIGRVGSTGVATGPHLHFEVRVNGDARDPMKYL